MELFWTIFNVLCIPAIAVIGCARRNLLEDKVPLWMQWLAICAEQYVVLSIILQLVKYLFGPDHVVGSRWYSVCAVVAALAFPIVRQWLHTYVQVVIKKAEDNTDEQEKAR